MVVVRFVSESKHNWKDHYKVFQQVGLVVIERERIGSYDCDTRSSELAMGLPHHVQQPECPIGIYAVDEINPWIELGAIE